MAKKINLEANSNRNSDAIKQLVDYWGNLFDRPSSSEKHLAKTALVAYVQALTGLKQLGANLTLLPANFEIYAWCVSSILEVLLSINPNKQNIIYVSTMLKQPLERWYNIALELDNSDLPCAFTRNPWEEYKQCIANLRYQENKTNHSIQLRRILPQSVRNDNDSVFIYIKPSDGLGVLTVEEAKGIYIPPCMQLREDIKNTLAGEEIEKRLYLIAQHVKNDTCTHPEWKPLCKHFEQTFHNRVHSHNKPVYEVEIGVYCSYTTIPLGPFEYEDSFVINMEAVDGGNFGIAFHVDKQRELSGVVFLTDAQVTRQLASLDKQWESSVND